jgi:hypothetical protein
MRGHSYIRGTRSKMRDTQLHQRKRSIIRWKMLHTQLQQRKNSKIREYETEKRANCERYSYTRGKRIREIEERKDPAILSIGAGRYGTCDDFNRDKDREEERERMNESVRPADKQRSDHSQ